MTSLTPALLADLCSPHAPPCLSLYQPTHRHHPENRQGPIRFRNLVRELEGSLRQKYSLVEAAQLLEPFGALAEDREFWSHTLDGLAVLAGPGLFLALKLPQAVAELAVVAESFHVKPLRRFLQSVDRFQVLCLSLDKVRLFEGNRHFLDEQDLALGWPRPLDEVSGGERAKPHPTTAPYGGAGEAPHAMHHGEGGRAEHAEVDAERFFRAVDRAVLASYSRPSGLPLLLAALPEHHHSFHRISQNPLLLADGLKLDPGSRPPSELRSLAWRTFEPRYLARLGALGSELAQAQRNGRGSYDLAKVAAASATGRVATLLIDADRQIPGRLDRATGQIERASFSDPQVDDLLDDVGELVSSSGGSVLVIPSQRMPSRTGLAATYRY